MYLDFFGLREQPFGVTPDPSFLYLSQTHRDALESLHEGLIADRGFLALVGEPGLGKTTLLYKLMDQLQESSRVVILFQTQCDSHEFFRYLLAELGVDAGSLGLAAMHQKLNHILFQEMLAGRRFVLIVDESQNLSDSVLETVRLLSNFETSHAKLLNVVLAGQTQLADKLATPELQQLRQRIAVLSRVRPLNPAEVTEYIKHRLERAGHCGAPLFTLGALQAIAKKSRGAPRSINNICHYALVAASEGGARSVNLETVQKVIAKLEGREIEWPFVPSEVPASMGTLTPFPAPRRASPLGPILDRAPDPSPAPAPAGPFFSYAAPPKSTSRYWRKAAIAVCVLLLMASPLALPSVRKYVEEEYKDMTWRPVANSSNVNVAPSTESTSGSTLPAYAPDPQDNDSGQVITVASKSGQTIEELSILYAGHFDPELYEQIFALNPGLNNPENLQSGQLIRLPLPPGTLKKVVDTADASKNLQSNKLELAINKVKEMFDGLKP